MSVSLSEQAASLGRPWKDTCSKAFVGEAAVIFAFSQSALQGFALMT